MLTGKTGVGKSSIINAIIGNNLAPEGKDLYGVTREVKSYKTTVNDVNFEIWDSPGLQDITEKDEVITERIKKTLKQNCPHLHLLLYCIRMDRDRVEVSELEAIKQLSHVFTPKIWDTAVFALTFANRVLPPSEMETDKEVTKWFKKRIEEFQEVIVRALVESGVPKDKAKQVPVIPTGYHKRTRLMPKPRELYDRPDWFNPFWQSCAEHMEENALIPLLASQKHRVKVVKGKTSSEQAEEYVQQQQELEKKEKELKEKARHVELEMEKKHQQIAEEKKLEEKHRMEEEKKMAEERKKQEEEIERARKKREEEDKQRKRRESEIKEQKLLLEQQRKVLEEQEQQRQLHLEKECKEKEQQRKEQEEQVRRRKQDIERERERVAAELRRVLEERKKLREAQAAKAEVFSNIIENIIYIIIICRVTSGKLKFVNQVDCGANSKRNVEKHGKSLNLFSANYQRSYVTAL